MDGRHPVIKGPHCFLIIIIDLCSMRPAIFLPISTQQIPVLVGCENATLINTFPEWMVGIRLSKDHIVFLSLLYRSLLNETRDIAPDKPCRFLS